MPDVVVDWYARLALFPHGVFTCVLRYKGVPLNGNAHHLRKSPRKVGVIPYCSMCMISCIGAQRLMRPDHGTAT